MQALLGLTEDADDCADPAGAASAWSSAARRTCVPLLPLLALVFGIEVPDTDVTAAIDPAFRRDRLNDAHRPAARRSTLPGTVLVLVDDAQWLDDASAGLLRHLLRRLPSGPGRSSSPVVRRRAGWCSSPVTRVEDLELGPLLPEAAEALVDRGSGRLPLWLRTCVEALVERGAGQPALPGRAGRGRPSTAVTPTACRTASRRPWPPPSTRCRRRTGLTCVWPRSSAVGSTWTCCSACSPGRATEQNAGWTPTAVVERLGRFLAARRRARSASPRDSSATSPTRACRSVAGGCCTAGPGTCSWQTAARRPGDELADLLSVHYAVAARHRETWTWARVAAERARRASAPRGGRGTPPAGGRSRQAPGRGPCAGRDDVGAAGGRLHPVRPARRGEVRLPSRAWPPEGVPGQVARAVHRKKAGCGTPLAPTPALCAWYTRGLKLARAVPASEQQRRATGASARRLRRDPARPGQVVAGTAAARAGGAARAGDF